MNVTVNNKAWLAALKQVLLHSPGGIKLETGEGELKIAASYADTEARSYIQVTLKAHVDTPGEIQLDAEGLAKAAALFKGDDVLITDSAMGDGRGRFDFSPGRMHPIPVWDTVETPCGIVVEYAPFAAALKSAMKFTVNENRSGRYRLDCVLLESSDALVLEATKQGIAYRVKLPSESAQGAAGAYIRPMDARTLLKLSGRWIQLCIDPSGEIHGECGNTRFSFKFDSDYKRPDFSPHLSDCPKPLTCRANAKEFRDAVAFAGNGADDTTLVEMLVGVKDISLKSGRLSYTTPADVVTLEQPPAFTYHVKQLAQALAGVTDDTLEFRLDREGFLVFFSDAFSPHTLIAPME